MEEPLKIEILDQQAFSLLKDMEKRKMIRLVTEGKQSDSSRLEKLRSLRGSLGRISEADIESTSKALRDEWA
jgi:hypothetical protein